jgi:hypothetical protein
MEITKSRSIHEVMKIVQAMCVLQTQGADIAIPYILGPPGIAKSSMTLQMCKFNNWNLIITHYGLRPIEEVSGIPQFKQINVNDTETTGTLWSLPDILTEIYELNPNILTVWFLDDMHIASPPLIALGYELFSERKLRGHKIPDNVAFVLAGNTSSKAGAKAMFSAVINRCAMLPVHLEFNEWKTKFAIPNNINSKIISFLSNSKYQKYAQEEEKVSTDSGWASFRSWTRFSNLLNPMEDFYKDVSHSDILYYAAAHVGEEAASEFTAYYKIFSQVEVDKIFDGLIDIVIPQDMSGQYVYLMATVSEFFNRYIKRKDQTARDSLIKTMSMILIELAKNRSEIATTGLKEIAVTETGLNMRNIYIKVHSTINAINAEVGSRISKDIHII